MENVNSRIDIRLSPNDEHAIKQFSKIDYKDSKYINGIYLVELYKRKIVYDKPIYVGTSILDPIKAIKLMNSCRAWMRGSACLLPMR